MATSTESSATASLGTATKACAACAHYKPTSEANGECRRHSPQTVVFQVDEQTRFESRFPSIKATDWCGEFFAKS